ncbi:excisionase family DNA binding protein [Angulomicrobium tetraedrale]|uniref:Excisionase family DNA binding protein n=1 Tax=Ancylobacter tetraedralis TaxID=217068 RepID=A0A839ZGK5_9HYPH|nr:helix-turn-helix domain-containing protein [Ancylobacter tetraedralis]MBB3773914.1 excisionase family DNA binding protein [Ancylobacter tetraedralis]
MPIVHSATKAQAEDLRKEVFTLRQLHHVFAIPPSSAYRYMAEGRLQSIKIGGRRLVRRADVETFLAVQAGEDRR